MKWFLLYLFVEIWVSVSFSSQVGFLLTFVEVVGSFVFGVAILVQIKSRFGQDIIDMMRSYPFDKTNLALYAFSLVGALLLLLPGVFSDLVGLCLQVRWLYPSLLRVVFKFKKYPTTKDNYEKNNETIIDAEIIDDRRDEYPRR